MELFPASDGTVYLLRGSSQGEFALQGLEDNERRLLKRLAAGFVGHQDLDDASSKSGSQSRSLLIQLGELDLLERGDRDQLLADDDVERFDRQLIYLADLAGPGSSAGELQLRLQRASVVILGCGGLGCWTASALVGAGVRQLTLVDDDAVELSNLNRQILFDESDIGRPKVKAAAATLQRHDSAVRINAVCRRVSRAADVTALLAGADLVIATADWPPYELPRWVNQACLEAGVPFISGGQFPPLVRIGPMVQPGISACLECHELEVRERHPLYEELTAYRARHPTPAATLGAVSGVVGSLLAMEAIHLLTGAIKPASIDSVFLLDLRTMELRREVIDRHPGCSRCR